MIQPGEPGYREPRTFCPCHGYVAKKCPKQRARRVAPRERCREDNALIVEPIGSGDFAFGSTVWPGLAKLIEECGEKLQIVGKLMQRGGRTDHWSGDLKPMAEDEIGDMIAAAQTFVELNADRLDVAKIERRIAMKRETFRGWHRDNLGNPAS